MNKDQLYDILRKYDDIEWEFPNGFDFYQADKQFMILVDLLKSIATISSFEHWSEIQDASFHGKIIFKMKDDDISLQLRVSNFGKLVTILNLCKVSLEKQALMKSLLIDQGYQFIPEKNLNSSYDGILKKLKGTWFTRFFDYI
ncbi:MAG: hypothetical protein HQK52_16550 [Oligoflexia bacterium]|nr:hypothetical protein [Oligoflexia bacterium]